MSIEHLDEANISDYLDTHHLNTNQWTLIIWTLIIWTLIIWTPIIWTMIVWTLIVRKMKILAMSLDGWERSFEHLIYELAQWHSTSVNELWSSRTNWIVSGKFSCHLATTLSSYNLLYQQVWLYAIGMAGESSSASSQFRMAQFAGY